MVRVSVEARVRVEAEVRATVSVRVGFLWLTLPPP